MVYMRWKGYGWQLGKILRRGGLFYAAALQEIQLPCGCRMDNTKGPASLTADNYASGPNAALDSWVILKKKTN
tara:strand:+ start:957 stop:1175 length:219 start_codon:yes stop_codon:yes gene_type:complete